MLCNLMLTGGVVVKETLSKNAFRMCFGGGLMKLALNYSPDAERLVNEGEIQIDCFKCPDWPELVTRAERSKPVYVHFGLNAGTNSPSHTNWLALEELRSRTATPYVNIHLIATIDAFPTFPVDTREAAHLDAVAASFIENVAVLVQRFGAASVIVENVVYRGQEGKVLYPSIAPEVITKVIEATGCGLLLDTAHARMSTLYLGISPQEYISRLPLQHLRELHITGIQHDGRLWRDSMPMSSEDWAVAEWVLENIRCGNWPDPWVVSFEYGGVGPKFEWRTDAKVLSAQVPRLASLVHRQAGGRGLQVE
jgi:uncharacterized protein (UPF0276 family)